uniref:Uncharacterized protein n=1 Tax=Arundo donax TaxID=35708 RepID=A0A0A9E7R5_ARUDO
MPAPALPASAPVPPRRRIRRG